MLLKSFKNLDRCMAPVVHFFEWAGYECNNIFGKFEQNRPEITFSFSFLKESDMGTIIFLKSLSNIDYSR